MSRKKDLRYRIEYFRRQNQMETWTKVIIPMGEYRLRIDIGGLTNIPGFENVVFHKGN